MPNYLGPVTAFYGGMQDAARQQAVQQQQQQEAELAKQRTTLFDQGQQDRQQQQADSSLLQNAISSSDRQTVMRLNPELAMKLDQEAGAFAKNGIEVLMSVKDNPEQFQQVAQSLAADARAKWLGVDVSHITPDGVAQLAAQMGTGMPQQPQPTGMAAEMALRNKDPSGYDAFLTNKERIGHMFDQETPQKPGYGSAQQGLHDGKPEQFIIDDSGNVKWLGIPPIPTAATTGATGTKAQQGKWQNDIRQAQIAFQQAREVAPMIGRAVGFISNAKAGAARVSGQTGLPGTEDLSGDVITARQKLAQFSRQTLQPLIMSQAKGLQEQKQLLDLLPEAGAWFTNEAQAKRNINEVMDWAQKKMDENALNLNQDPQSLPRWEPLQIDVTQGDSGDPEHDAKVDTIMKKSFSRGGN